jgi:hypothetical protein
LSLRGLRVALERDLGTPLSPDESRVLEGVTSGQSHLANTPIALPGAVIRASFLAALLTREPESDHDANGAEEKGYDLREVALAQIGIEGLLDISYTASRLPLVLHECTLDAVDATAASIPRLVFSRCTFTGTAEDTTAGGNDGPRAFWDTEAGVVLQLDEIQADDLLIDECVTTAEHSFVVTMRGAVAKRVRVTGSPQSAPLVTRGDIVDGAMAAEAATRLLPDSPSEEDVQLLAVVLYAAAIMDEPFARVLRWLNNIALGEITAILDWKDTEIGGASARELWRETAQPAQRLALLRERVEDEAPDPSELVSAATGDAAFAEAYRLIGAADRARRDLVAALLLVRRDSWDPLAAVLNDLRWPHWTGELDRKTDLLAGTDTRIGEQEAATIIRTQLSDFGDGQIVAARALRGLLRKTTHVPEGAPRLVATDLQATDALILADVRESNFARGTFGRIVVTGIVGELDFDSSSIKSFSSNARHRGRRGRTVLNFGPATIDGALGISTTAAIVAESDTDLSLDLNGASVGFLSLDAIFVGFVVLQLLRANTVEIRAGTRVIGRHGGSGRAVVARHLRIRDRLWLSGSFLGGGFDLSHSEVPVVEIFEASFLGTMDRGDCLTLESIRAGTVRIEGHYTGRLTFDRAVLSNLELGKPRAVITTPEANRKTPFRVLRTIVAPRDAGGIAVSARRIVADGDVRFLGVDFYGTVLLDDSKIAGLLSARGQLNIIDGDEEEVEVGVAVGIDSEEGPSFFPSRSPASSDSRPLKRSGLSLTRTRVDGTFQWYPRSFGVACALDLTGCSVATLDDRFFWEIGSVRRMAERGEAERLSHLVPDRREVRVDLTTSPPFWMGLQGQVELRNFRYGDIDRVPAREEQLDVWVESRLRWIRLSTTRRYSPTPYEQLADILLNRGYKHLAYKTLQARLDDERPGLGRWTGLVNQLMSTTTGHGYELGRIVVVYLTLILAGVGAFDVIHQHGGAVHRDGKASFSALGLSVDTSVPFFSIGSYDADWVGAANRWGDLFIAWSYAETILGLLTGVLLALALSRRIKERTDPGS